MTRRISTLTVGCALIAMTGTSMLVRAQVTVADFILSTGKIITVDERFTIAQAVAITGDRILAVGTNQEIGRLAGAGTRRIDLGGKAVIPGLIDNHMHLVRAGVTWKWEVRLDGVESRKQALEMVRARARAVSQGEWIYTLGGWTIDQFSDDTKPFTREELDEVAPVNPVLLQASYYEAYLNSTALEKLGIDDKTPAAPWLVRGPTGKPTGRIGETGFRSLVGRLPIASPSEIEASTTAMIADLNRMGLTTFGSAGCEADLLGLYRRWADEKRLNVRVFCINGVGVGTTPEQVERALPQIAQMKLFQGDNYVDHISYGEGVYGPLHDPMFLRKSDPKPEQLALWRRIATEIAKAGLPLHVHANLKNTIDGFLDQIEAINKEYPIKNHANQLNASHLVRMRGIGDVRCGSSLGGDQRRNQSARLR